MDRKEIQREIELMQAYLDGKEILIESKTRGWILCENPTFDFTRYSYRIEGEDKYTPYEDESEFICDMSDNGHLIQLKDGTVVSPVTFTDKSFIYVSDCLVVAKVTYEQAMELGMKWYNTGKPLAKERY